MKKSTSPFLLLFLSLCLLIGCVEDEIDITVNKDGSGTITRKVTLSERMVVSMSEKKGASSQKMDVPTTLEEAKKKMGDAVQITSLNKKDNPDGSVTFNIKGTFKDAKAFFSSSLFQKELKLHFQKNGKGTLDLHFSGSAMSSSGSIKGPTMTSLYGAMKGMYMRRSITMPVALSGTKYGKLENNNRKVTWALDMRNKEALKKSVSFVEGKDAGKDKVTLAGKLNFDVPLGAIKASGGSSSKPAAPLKTEVKEGPSDLKLVATRISWDRKKSLVEERWPSKSSLDIDFKLSWPKGQKPIAYYEPELTSITDDKGTVLLEKKDSFGPRRSNIGKYSEEDTQISLRLPSPATDAKFLLNIKGHVRVITKSETKTITISDISKITGAEPKSYPALMVAGFHIKEAKEKEITIEMDGQKEKIAGLTLIKKSGKRLDKNGYSGWKNKYSYYFTDKVEPGDKLEVKLRVKDEMVKMPISFEKLELP